VLATELELCVIAACARPALSPASATVALAPWGRIAASATPSGTSIGFRFMTATLSVPIK
jgi:hypothetical protein